MKEPYKYTSTEVINLVLNAGSFGNVFSLYSTTFNQDELDLMAAGYKVIVNRYVKALKAMVKISSLQEIAIPDIIFDPLTPSAQTNSILRELQWKGQRKHLNLYTQTNNIDWNLEGIVSCVARGDLPYYKADLMGFFTDGLAGELGGNGTIGVAIEAVGWGVLVNDDYVKISGSLVKEVEVFDMIGDLQESLRIGKIDLVSYLSADPGCLLCQGQAISRTLYSKLYAKIGTLYGIGDGTTTFNVPDMRGRSALGSGTGSGLTNRILGSNGGTEDAVIPAHTHTTQAGTANTAGTILTRGNVTSAIGIASGSTGVSATGANLQPFLTLNYQIYTGVFS